MDHCKSLFLHYIPKISLLYNRVLVPPIIMMSLVNNFAALFMIEDCMCCYSLLASVAAFCKSFHAKESSIYIFITWNTLYPVSQSHVIIIFYDNTLLNDLRMRNATLKYHYAFMNIRKESNGEFAFGIISKHALLNVFEFQHQGNVLFFAL